MIELFSFPHSPQRSSFPERCGLRHLAFGVDNVLKKEKNSLLKAYYVKKSG
jgi:glyoxylase I family protein